MAKTKKLAPARALALQARVDQLSSVRLTPRQREVVQLVAEGNSSKEVAVALNLSVKTAETHRANIMRKLDFHSVTEVVRYAIRNEIIQAQCCKGSLMIGALCTARRLMVR